MRRIALSLATACGLCLLAPVPSAEAIEVDVGSGVHVGVGPIQVDVGRGRLGRRRPAPPLHYRASELMGLEVRDADGQRLGEVKDVVLDLNTDRARYAVVELENGLGEEDHLYAIPFRALSLHHHEDGKFFILGMRTDLLRRSPGFEEGKWPPIRARYWIDVDEYFE